MAAFDRIYKLLVSGNIQVSCLLQLFNPGLEFVPVFDLHTAIGSECWHHYKIGICLSLKCLMMFKGIGWIVSGGYYLNPVSF